MFTLKFIKKSFKNAKDNAIIYIIKLNKKEYDMFSNFLAFGADQAGQTTGYTGMAITLVIWGAIFYFFLIRPNKKKQKKHAEMIESLQPGTGVITAGGIKGEVVSVSDDYIVIRVDKGVRLTFTKDSIRKML